MEPLLIALTFPLLYETLIFIKRGRRFRQHVPDQRGSEEQRLLPVRASRHFQKHLQDRHNLVPFRRPALRNEVRQLDL